MFSMIHFALLYILRTFLLYVANLIHYFNVTNEDRRHLVMRGQVCEQSAVGKVGYCEVGTSVQAATENIDFFHIAIKHKAYSSRFTTYCSILIGCLIFVK